VETNRKRKRADERRRRVLKRVRPLVRAVGRELAREALRLLADGWPPEQVARLTAGRAQRAR
jgi:hypothetical protein